MTRVVLVPGALALLPEYAGIEDPVVDLRVACLDAVRWLGADPRVVATPQGGRVAAYLTSQVATPSTDGVLVVANGSAKRTEKAPGHLDERALPFDEALRASLTAGRLGGLDQDLARELWADVESLVRLGQEIDVDPASVQVDYDDDPHGVQYWVMRMEGQWRARQGR